MYCDSFPLLPTAYFYFNILLALTSPSISVLNRLSFFGKPLQSLLRAVHIHVIVQMPVKIRPARHAANIQTWPAGVKDAAQFLETIRGVTGVESLMQSSFQNLQDGPSIISHGNGFVHTAVRAYSKHLHLVIRPEDVWFAILTQLSIYISEHAEELRGSFVSHDGQKNLKIVEQVAYQHADFGEMSNKMAALIQENLVDPTLRAWIQPDFTTTTKEDVTVSSMIMMGVLQKYFTYTFSLVCGLPSVTLLGEKEDWESILRRLDRIQNLGEEPGKWYSILVPVITHFVKSFDTPDHPDTIDFWQKIAHYSGGGSGPTYLSGWITAFCFWDKMGTCMYKREEFTTGLDSVSMFDINGRETPRLFLSGVPYHRIDSSDIPPGYVSVPVTVQEGDNEYKATIIAGSVGMKITSSGDPGVVPPHLRKGSIFKRNKRLIGMDTVQPVTGWFIFRAKNETD